MKKIVLHLCRISLVLILFFTLSCAKKQVETTEEIIVEETTKSARIFIVHSYEKTHVCGAPQESGIKRIFEESDYETTWEYYYMNTKTENASLEKKLEQAEIVKNKIELFKPDVLFVLDDNAIKYVGTHFIGRDFFVVFSGMNGQAENYSIKTPFLDENGLPNNNMTGVYEFLHVQKSMETMYKLFPITKKVLTIIDETPTGNAITKQLDLELSGVKLPFEVEIRRVKTLIQYKKLIKEINQSKEYGFVYNIALGLQTEDGSQVGVPVTFKYYLEHSKIPSIALNYAFSKLGLFGGVAVNFEEMGAQTAEMAVKLLNGTPIKDIPIENDEEYMIIFNEARAKQLNIHIPNEVIMIADELYDSMKLLK